MSLYTNKELAMSKIKEAKRSILQIMPADGWMAVCTDEEGDGTPPQTTRVPLFAWAIVRDIDGKRASTQVTGLFVDDDGQICEACWYAGFLRYERIENLERPYSAGK
jgi:hypothetical protein